MEKFFGSSFLWKLVTTKAFRAALLINSSTVPTPLEWLVLGCIGVFASFAVFYFLWIYFILFQLISTTVSNNRFYFWGAPLQQQTELQLLFGCCQQQAERLVSTYQHINISTYQYINISTYQHAGEMPTCR